MIALLALKSLLVGLVFLGALPLLLAEYQFLLAAGHSRRLHYAHCRPYRPRISVLVPAWNEAAVQLHSRANIEAIGGRIDTGTLAEDTVTTFQTQLSGHRAIFEPHAAVWAEEPMAIAGLWRQRLRWARGNLQVTGRFRGLWFRPGTPGGLGGLSCGLIWFSPLFVYIGGYGPLLCASTVAAYLKELRHAEAHWAKTEKTGRAVSPV